MVKHSSHQYGNQFSGFGHQSEKFSSIGTCIRLNFTPWGYILVTTHLEKRSQELKHTRSHCCTLYVLGLKWIVRVSFQTVCFQYFTYTVWLNNKLTFPQSSVLDNFEEQGLSQVLRHSNQASRPLKLSLRHYKWVNKGFCGKLIFHTSWSSFPSV